ncbi:MAG: hypothetical protein OXG35_02215, partial [Acidobacteria bacterium]|nr:hypothetical protein [Acidobacteriota bacterium]
MVTNRLSAIAGCFGLVCVPLLTAAQSPDVDALDAGPDTVAHGASKTAGAIDATPDGGGPDATPDGDVLDATLDIAGPDALDTRFAARRIIDRALEQAVEQRAAAFELGFEYFTDGRVESLDGDGRVTDTDTTRNRHYPIEGHFYSEVIGRDGRPLD